MAKKSANPRKSRTLAEREIWLKKQLDNIATRKQIAELKKKLKS
jgi:hypothetical protein